MIKIIIAALAAVIGFSGGSNKVDNIKIYDQCRTEQLKIENEKMIEENAKCIERNEKNNICFRKIRIFRKIKECAT